jgi:ABC-type sugar transport system, ATPase component
MIRAEAGKDRTFLWYTTEMDELKHCDHVYVFRNGRIAADLARDELSEEKVCTPPSRKPRDARGDLAAASLLPAHAAQSAAGPVADRLAGAIFYLQPRA